ncbi:MAG: nucleoside kinase [Clostridia bacterium]|nr:nucleoside kinase [Clostridia bacterium]
MEFIEVKLPDGKKKVRKGATLEEILEAGPGKEGPLVVAARVNNVLQELTTRIEEEAEIVPVDLGIQAGVRIYSRSLILVLARATRELFPNSRLRIEHSLNKGLYGEIYLGRPFSEKDLRRIEERMQEIIAADEKIEKLSVPVEEARRLFAKDGQEDKVRLLEYAKTPEVRIYRCGWFHDYFYDYLVPRTGYLRLFELRFHLPGFILRYPTVENPLALPVFVDQRKLGEVFYEHALWGRTLNLSDVAALNKYIKDGRGPELIRVSEALHEKNIVYLADQITRDRGRLRLVLVAGPSSSGKTTFVQRLSVQLRVNGVRPVLISMDDYFLDREFAPRMPNGDPDFEAIENIDLELFNEHLALLILGEEIEIPRFNFLTGKREFRGEKLKIAPDQPVIIEGIHGLNERLTAVVPKDRKFKIYVSALTQLNLDDHNRIPTTDNRLIRRIVRDSRFRSHGAAATLRLWPLVRRGEELNIFPFQEEADAMFNSNLIYELAVLKPYIEPLLAEVTPDSPEYSEAERLLRFLSYFLPLSCREVPGNSLLREFIGGSCFFLDAE